jgi:hypothetical protein
VEELSDPGRHQPRMSDSVHKLRCSSDIEPVHCPACVRSCILACARSSPLFLVLWRMIPELGELDSFNPILDHWII